VGYVDVAGDAYAGDFPLPALTSICSAVWRFPGAIQQFQLVAFAFGKDRFLAEIADQVKGYPEGYDILKEEQAQKAHVPYPVNKSSRAWGSYDHSAGCEEHARRDEPAYDTGFRLQIACDNQYGGSDLGKADDIGADIRAE
jgi:hypothetical protein